MAVGRQDDQARNRRSAPAPVIRPGPWPTASVPVIPIQTPILDGFGQVLGGDQFGAGDIGYGAGYFEDAVVGAGGEGTCGGRPVPGCVRRNRPERQCLRMERVGMRALVPPRVCCTARAWKTRSPMAEEGSALASPRNSLALRAIEEQVQFHSRNSHLVPVRE